MGFVFTLCSNNYLAQAKTLGDSLIMHNPDFRFIIGLVDRIDKTINYDFFKPHEIVVVEDVLGNTINDLLIKYDIIELNTCVKPSFFKWIFEKYECVENVIYLDPDIYVYNSFNSVEEILKESPVIVTPHILSHLPLDGKSPSENIFLNYGLFNLGFIAFSSKHTITPHILNWWEERVLKYGYNKLEDGLFVDQLWINFLPIYFPETYIIRLKGYNVAPWNLHERSDIQAVDGKLVMNDGSDLVFFHFSSFRLKNPSILSSLYNRFNFENCPSIVKELYEKYHQEVISNNYMVLSQIPCYYIDQREKYFQEDKHIIFLKLLRSSIKFLIPPVLVWGVHKVLVQLRKL